VHNQAHVYILLIFLFLFHSNSRCISRRGYCVDVCWNYSRKGSEIPALFWRLYNHTCWWPVLAVLCEELRRRWRLSLTTCMHRLITWPKPRSVSANHCCIPVVAICWCDSCSALRRS